MLDQEHGYEHSSPFDSGMLSVGAIHKIHYEQYGKEDGKPGRSYQFSESSNDQTNPLKGDVVIFLHGGPGGSTSKSSTVFFDPSKYRVVLCDQRGAGKSTPSGELRENTSQHLVADIDALRQHLGITKWHLVFGGSWGSALSLMYAQAHPDSVGSIILRGVHTCRKAEYAWSRGNNGAARLYPDAYEAFLSALPEADREDPIAGYYKLMTSNYEAVRIAAAREWNRWDLTLSNLKPSYAQLGNTEWILVHARLETHYFSNGCWVEDGELLRKENIDRIRHIPSEYLPYTPGDLRLVDLVFADEI